METDLKFIRLVTGIEEAEHELAEILDDLQIKHAAMIIGPTISAFVPKTIEFISKKIGRVPIFEPNNNSETEVISIIEGLKNQDVEIIVGIGGGRTIDVAKMAAKRLNVNVISFPTLVSHDGIASPVAVLLNSEEKKQSLPARMPVAVVVDLDVIGRAPLASIRAGVGDLVSNFSALEDWKLAARKAGETYHDLAAVISHSAACSIFEMSEVGETYARHPDFIRRLVEGLILSGVAMSIAGNSRPASGAEHNISHAIDALYNLNAYHGEQVALGTILTTYLRSGPWEKFLDFYKRLGLPVTSLDIGLSEKQYVRAVLEAPRTRKDRYTILNELQLTDTLVSAALHDIKGKLVG
jgi:glycerol-1-phosphate dehydrogenase [NAD(P)+]